LDGIGRRRCKAESGGAGRRQWRWLIGRLALRARVRVRPILVLAAVALMAAGCGSDSPRRRYGPSPIVFSPNGEPLSGGPLGKVACRDAIGRWFDRTDANGDGTLTFEEFEADARRQFAAMDEDSDGYVTPPELADMRAPYRPTDTTSPVLAVAPPSSQAAQSERQSGGKRGERGGGGGGGGGGRGERGGSPGSRSAAGRVDDGSIDQADPVMSADANVDFRVSLAEFLAQARRVYARLGAGAGGRLTRVGAVEGICRDDRHEDREE